MDAVLNSNVSEEIKDSLLEAMPYAEGKGIQIEIKDSSKMPDIQKLIEKSSRLF